MGGRRYSNSQSSRVIPTLLETPAHHDGSPFYTATPRFDFMRGSRVKTNRHHRGLEPSTLCLPLNQVALRLWSRSLKFPLSTRQTASTPRLAVSPLAALGFSAWTGPLFKELIMRIRVLPSDRSRIARMEKSKPFVTRSLTIGRCWPPKA